MYIYKLPTVDESKPMAPHSITISPRCTLELNFFPWIARLYVDTYLILRIKQAGIKYYFWVFGLTHTGIEPQFPWIRVCPSFLRQLLIVKEHINLHAVFNGKVTLAENYP